MPHRLSAAATLANARSDCYTRDLITITLPDPIDPITLFLATADVIVASQFYVGKIRALPTLVYSEGGNVDGGEFTIENASNLYGPTFLNTDRTLDGSTVVWTRAWLLPNAQGVMDPATGTWEIETEDGEPYELGSGRLVTRPINDDAIQCQFVSEFSDSSIEIGGSMISQRCLKFFNKNGSHPLGGACGYKLTFLQNQVETAIIEGTITGAGNVRVIVTAPGMTGTPRTVDVAVLLGDNESAIAGKIRAALKLDANVSAFFDVSGIGPAVKLITKTKAAIDAAININVNNLTSAGLVPAPTSENTSAIFCNKIQNSPEGCSGHGNFRHGGVPGLNPTAADLPASDGVLDPIVPNGGYGDNPYPRKSPMMDIDVRPMFNNF